MSKKYQILRDVIQNADGGFVERLRVALVEFACLGERRFDVAGYPYDSEAEALEADWRALGGDARVAIDNILAEAEGADGKRQEGASPQKQYSTATD